MTNAVVVGAAPLVVWFISLSQDKHRACAPKTQLQEWARRRHWLRTRFEAAEASLSCSRSRPSAPPCPRPRWARAWSPSAHLGRVRGRRPTATTAIRSTRSSSASANRHQCPRPRWARAWSPRGPCRLRHHRHQGSTKSTFGHPSRQQRRAGRASRASARRRRRRPLSERRPAVPRRRARSHPRHASG